MNFLHATQNRLAEARNNEGGFSLTEILMGISLLAILFAIIFNAVGGTLLPALVTPSLEKANNLDLEPAQVAAGDLYKSIDAFTRDHPDTAPTTALLTAGGYVNEPSNIVWAFHTYGGPASPQRCVIAYIADDASSDYTASNPAAFDSLYQFGSIGQNCKHQVSGSSKFVPNWDSE